jgi:hypothetical protein
MHNYRRQKRIAADVKPGVQETESESQDNDTGEIVELERPLVLSPERWSTDPFDSFPIKMQQYMHDLLSLCKSPSPLIYRISSYIYQIASLYRNLLIPL